MTTEATPGALGSNDQLGLAPELAEFERQVRPLCDRLRAYADGPCVAPDEVLHEAAEKLEKLDSLLRSMHGTLQRAADAAQRVATHSDGCWTWGPRHYQCAVAKVKWLRELVQAIVDTRHTYGWGPEADAAIESARVGLGPNA